MNNIRSVVEEILAGRDLTKKWLAGEIDVSVGNLNRTLENINVENLVKTSKALGVSIDSLIDGNYSDLNNEENVALSGKEYQIPNDGKFRLVPIVNTDAVGGLHSSNDIGVTDPEYLKGLIPIIEAQEHDLCLQVTGTSMIPTCPPGSIVQIREVPRWREYFGYGGIFVLQLIDGRRIIKEVTKCEQNPKDYVLCVSHNKEVPTEELPKDFIVSVWKVIKILTNRGW